VEGTTIIGSAAHAGISVNDPTISRLHAEVDVRGDGVWLRDLNSRNGLFVEGMRITGARIPLGAKVRMGSTEFLFEAASEKQPVDIWPHDSFGRLVGRSVVMRELFATLGRVAPSDSAVFINGETGTGKEVIALAIHEASPRKDKPFVVVDCAALPEHLLDAELFGHSKGAFTGATGARVGAIEAAEGGVVFLDEIGELPISMQTKLLRVLESRTVRRVGETSYRPVNVRFISATHRDLLTMVNAGEFREDLYFRLAVLPISVPPLRARVEDIESLVNHFWTYFGGEGQVSPELMRALVSRPWRGNVRELRNFVERARALGANEALAMTSPMETTQVLSGARLPPPSSPTLPTADPLPVDVPMPAQRDPKMFERAYKEFRDAWVDLGEQEYVRRLLARHDGNVARAAVEAGVDRTYIYRLIRKHSL
jgi:DNA-binding NtrC family response regulator